MKIFFCADCSKSRAFKKDKDTYVALMNSVARILYVYFEQYELLDVSINKAKEVLLVKKTSRLGELFKDESIKEERKLFYVGITRAIDDLYLFSPRNRKGQFKDVCRFIVEGKLNDMTDDTLGYEVGDKVAHRTNTLSLYQLLLRLLLQQYVGLKI